MTDNLRQPRQLAGLPFDVLLKIFSECDVDDVLSLSATCKVLNEVSGEHKTWLDQVTRLQIPTPKGAVASTAELKDRAISWLRSDKLWVKPQDDGDDRPLSLHRFNMHSSGLFVMANLIPGGKFVVSLYTDGHIELREIKIESEGEWGLRNVARYEQRDPDGFYPTFCSQLLTETNLGCPLVAYVDQREEGLHVFLVDHIAGTIEQKQVARFNISFHDVRGIHARGDIILCFYGYDHGWGIAVSELGPDPTLKLFTLSVKRSPQPRETQFFMLSENAVVMCDAAGIHLYHIPEVTSAEDSSTLRPVWEWLGDSQWFCGGVCTMYPQCPMLYLQGSSGTHTITFRMDASGRDSVVVEHHVGEDLSARLTHPETGDYDRFVMKGRKGLYYCEGTSYTTKFATCLLGREELTGGFSAKIEPDEDWWDEHDIRFADFDERTGRILISTNRCGAYNEGEALRIYLADLPL